MNREIKFRIWSGSVMYESFNLVELFGIGGNYIQVQKRNENGDKVLNDGYEIMQYTGLKDKNGKEIYEGDILDFENGYITEIFWESNGFRLNDKSIHSDLSHGVVIGNIYENPDLLK